MTEYKKVSIIDRWSRGAWTLELINVTVPWICCVCGGPRGEPYDYRFSEDGEFFCCHRWDNPCGHVDLYRDVFEQAREEEWAKCQS